MTDDVTDTANALTIAEARLCEMQAHLDVARETVAANVSKARSIAFDVESGDAAARRLADKLMADNHKLLADIEHIKAPALDEAKRRVEAARKAEAAATMHARAEEAKAIALKLEAIGAGRDKCFEEARTLGYEFEAALNRLRQLGAPAPSRELVDSNQNRALDAALQGLYPAARAVAPLERHKFATLYKGWGAMALQWSAKILDADARRAA